MATCNGFGSTRQVKKKCLTVDNINPGVKVMEYAIAGPVTKRYFEIVNELEKVRNYFNCYKLITKLLLIKVLFS